MAAPDPIQIFFHFIIRGLPTTLLLTALGLLGGFILGIMLALMRVYGKKELVWLASGYEKLFRGIPILILMYLLIFGLPDLFWYLDLMDRAFASIILAFTLHSGAYQSQIFRGAILSVNPGQMDAARAIGMNEFQTFRYVIIPQALRLAIPSWSNEYAVVIKDTSLVLGLGFVEVSKLAYDIGVAYKELWTIALGISALIYLLCTFPVTKFFGEKQTKKLKRLGLGGG